MIDGGPGAHWLWLAAGIVLAIAELVAPGVFLIWIAAAAVLTGLATLIFAPPVAFQCVLFALFAIGTVYWGRRVYADNPVDSSDPMLNDRTSRLRGRVVEVVDAIENGRGRVRVGDGVWDVRGPDTPAGAHVRVVGADGTCLKVTAASAESSASEPM